MVTAESPKIAYTELRSAAADISPVKGLTHGFYKYPARFSPTFAAAAIRIFSKPGDLVVDPYMGGGTTIIEAAVSGRRAIGTDLNELSAFIASVKTTPLTTDAVRSIRKWATDAAGNMHFRFRRALLEDVLNDHRTHNMTLPAARPLKKALAGALLAAQAIPIKSAQRFARCVLLRVGQWAADGRRSAPTLEQIRLKLAEFVEEMLAGMDAYRELVPAGGKITPRSFACDATKIDRLSPFAVDGELADLVVTSPPYPGVHLLYHRWQINGRREAPAPYWVSDCQDGHGASFYNFGGRRGAGIDKYFEVSLATLLSIRRVCRSGAYFIQMIAFSDPDQHLVRYLANMEQAGFAEVPWAAGERRIWRGVPQRKWHAQLQGRTHSANEVVLVHRAS